LRIVFLIFFLFPLYYISQDVEFIYKELQYGFSIKGALEIGINKENKPKVVYRLSAGTGIGTTVFDNSWYPSINADIQLYNGGFGSKNEMDNKTKPSLDITLAMNISKGWKNQFSVNNTIKLLERNVPLYYFSDFNPPALQNPFKNSISLGTNFIFSFDKNRKIQQIGFVNVNTFDGVQLSFYNDGWPFHFVELGDNFDRFYTGGILLSVNTQNKYLNLIEAGYHRFSGSFYDDIELIKDLDLENVEKIKKEQEKYNKSLIRFNFVNSENNVSLGMNFYNYKEYDIQHFIHILKNNQFNVIPYKKYFTINPSFFKVNTSISYIK